MGDLSPGVACVPSVLCGDLAGIQLPAVVARLSECCTHSRSPHLFYCCETLLKRRHWVEYVVLYLRRQLREAMR